MSDATKQEPSSSSSIKEENGLKKPDNDDAYSVETLLSDWDESDDEDEAKPSKRKRGLAARRKQLEKKFRLRKEILERLVDGKSRSYVEMLQYHEELVRTETFRLLEQDENAAVNQQQAAKDKTSDIKESDESTPKTDAVTEKGDHTRGSATFFTNFKHLVLFETGLCLPAFLCIVFYCSGHLAFYEIIYCLMGEISRYFNVSYDWVCIGAIILSFFMLRMTGGLWEWSSIDNHAVAKFELHNRIRLGYWDAKLHRWFRKQKTLSRTIQLVALYMCCAGVGHMQYLMLVPFTSDRSWVLDKLPSKEHGISTPVTLWLQGLYTQPCDGGTSGAEMQECRLYDKLTVEDDAVVNEMISAVSYARMFGDHKAHVLSPLANEVAYILMTSVSFFFMFKLGAQVFD